MERYTEKILDKKSGKIKSYSICKGKETEAILRLGMYEDIGLTPLQIFQIDALYLDKCKEVNELKKKIAELEKVSA